MRTNKELRRGKLAALKRELAIGIEQLKRGEFYEFGSAKELLEHINTETHKRQKRSEALRRKSKK